MTHLYRCPECRLNLTVFETSMETEYVTSEAWGARATTQHRFMVCGYCGSDVEEVESDDTDDEVMVD